MRSVLREEMDEMATVIRLKHTLLRDRVQKDLQSGFLDDNIKRTIFGGIVVLVSSDIKVLIKLKPEKVTIYATLRFLAVLLSFRASGTTVGGMLLSGIEDEKKKAERKYVEWFTDQYHDFISS